MIRAGRLALLALIPLAGATGQEKSKRAQVCPWCKNDPETMARAGVISHGPIAIGPKGSEQLATSLPTGAWIFLETPHLRWAWSPGAMTVELDDKKRVMAELDRLRLVLPGVPEEPKRLDPWLRLHLFAMKGEELYARFQKILQVADADFPEERTVEGPFMGNGRFLGEKDKFEVVIHTTRASHTFFTQDFSGVRVTDSFRWHFKALHKLLVSVPAEDPDLKKDKWLFPHVVHNLSHAFFCAYKHFSYDPPVWIDEGLAHAMEKEWEPESTTSDGEEGTLRDTRGPADWTKATRLLLLRGKQSPMAELMRVKEFGEMDQDANLTAWSMVRFLIEERADAFAHILGGVKGQLDEKGWPTGKDLPDLQRKLFREAGAWTPAGFDEAWKTWAAKQGG